MKTENTNDFSKCRVGDKLWLDPLDCEVTVSNNQHPIFIKIADTSRDSGYYSVVKTTGFLKDGYKQVLYFGKPQIIAPPEPPRLPDYKPGQWIAVWFRNNAPCIRMFIRFADDQVLCASQDGNGYMYWDNHCTLEELPEVLAKLGEKK